MMLPVAGCAHASAVTHAADAAARRCEGAYDREQCLKDFFADALECASEAD